MMYRFISANENRHTATTAEACVKCSEILTIIAALAATANTLPTRCERILIHSSALV